LDCGPGGHVLRLQEQTNQLPNIVPGNWAARLFGQIGSLAIGVVLAVGVKQAGNHGMLKRIREQSAVAA
jgi:hypothetical protein